MIETLMPPEGIISIYEISENWAQDKAEFDYYWLPETRLINGVHRIVRPARVSDGEKRERRMMEPVHNLMTTAGVTQLLTNQSVTAQGSMQPISQIFSVGNGAITGVLRSDTAVAGDTFVASARKVPASRTQVGFLATILINFASGDANGTWTNCGWYGGGSATTTAATGTLETHALFPFSKGAAAYSVNYSYLMSN